MDSKQEAQQRIRTGPMDIVDLHVHSTFSDGFFTPEELVMRAHSEGVKVLALCDHDNVAGIEPARAAAGQIGMEVLSGVELSSRWKGFHDLHILGYGFDPHHDELCRELDDFQRFRGRRNALIVERVNRRLAIEHKAPIDFARVRELAGGTVGRPHIAQALLEKGHVADTSEAFQRYLVPCNVEKRFFPAVQAIPLVHRAGGVAVLAHPPLVTNDRRALERLFDDLKALGLDGVEAYSNGACPEDVDYLIAAARRRELIVTGGSDFHGLDAECMRLGWSRGQLPIPLSCALEIKDALGRRSSGPM